MKKIRNRFKMLLIILNAAIVLNVIFSTTVASQDLNIVLKKKAVHPNIKRM